MVHAPGLVALDHSLGWRLLRSFSLQAFLKKFLFRSRSALLADGAWPMCSPFVCCVGIKFHLALFFDEAALSRDSRRRTYPRRVPLPVAGALYVRHTWHGLLYLRFGKPLHDVTDLQSWVTSLFLPLKPSLEGPLLRQVRVGGKPVAGTQVRWKRPAPAPTRHWGLNGLNWRSLYITATPDK